MLTAATAVLVGAGLLASGSVAAADTESVPEAAVAATSGPMTEAGPGNCADWVNVTPAFYTDHKDAYLRLQARSCTRSDGVRIKYARAVVCNRVASGKTSWSVAMFRDRGEALVYDGPRRGWPSVGHCESAPTPGIRAWNNHEYHAVLYASDITEPVYTTVWGA